MKIFILEDDIERIEFLEKWVKAYIDHKAEIHLAKSFAEACDIFENHDYFDFMLLDHDLKFCFMDSSEPETGYQVAMYMKNQGIKYDQCIIHSLNVDGANGMHSLLPHSVCVPIFALGFKYNMIKYAKNKVLGDAYR